MNKISEFQQILKQQGQALYRPMPWREDTQPYYVLVSELMLQQTQVERVIPKFNQFITRFPDINALAAAPLSDVLRCWQGLGYNRRAKFLHQTAVKITQEHGGKFPETQEQLVTFPGVGQNTAGAIAAYAFNQPVLFIETNIRTVYIHHFFADDFDIPDTAIREVLTKTLDHHNPRQFYWALMDYGSYLKRNGVKNNARAKSYRKQSPLKGSLREARGIIVKALSQGELDIYDFRRLIAVDDRFDVALEGLINEGLVVQDGQVLKLSD